MTPAFWKGRRVFITGHTGFKGAWLSVLLKHRLQAEIAGYALTPPTEPSLYRLAGLDRTVPTVSADIRDRSRLVAAVREARPEVVFHLAAQPLVRLSYRQPVETFEVNVLGTANLLDAVCEVGGVKAVVVITTDKCYENREWAWGYRENDRLGGRDPYSNSKACAELVTASFRDSFFSAPGNGTLVATARAGNVIGGGDWAADRLIPDCVRAILAGQPIVLRNPGATRPWQHVLEPLAGYLLLAERLAQGGREFAQGWNFGPRDEDVQPVGRVVEQFCGLWGRGAEFRIEAEANAVHEASILKLDCSLAEARLGWRPRWRLQEALARIVEWTRAYQRGGDAREVCQCQMDAYFNTES